MNYLLVPTDDYKEYLRSLNDFDTLNKLHWDTKRQVNRVLLSYTELY